MSKIAGEDLRAAINKIQAEKDKTKFVQTVELQIKLRNYDPAKDKRFAGMLSLFTNFLIILGSVKLPAETRPKFKVCILGDHKHCEDAKKLGLDFKTEKDLTNMNKNKKIIKKFADGYHAFLASDSLIKKIPRIMGPGLSKAGKFPGVLTPTDDITVKIAELKQTVKFQLKKEVNLATPVGHLNQTEEQLLNNITMSINFLVSLLKKNWQNIGSITIKGTMTKPIRIYP